MKKIPQQEPAVIDKNYINSIYKNLTEKISLLDELNQQYKKKQEVHFLRTFMSVIEKLGNQLIFAQEAYKNVDIEAKKDSYCLQLAEELNFFKSESVNLSRQLNAVTEELKKTKIEKQNLQSELSFTKNLYEKQTSSNIKLKNEIKELKKQIKSLMSAPGNQMNHSVGSTQPLEMSAQNRKEMTSLSLGNKLKLNKAANPEPQELSPQKSKLKEYETVDSWQMEMKSRNFLTLTPVGEIGRLPKHLNATQRSFRARKQSRQLKTKLPNQYFVG